MCYLVYKNKGITQQINYCYNPLRYSIHVQ